MAKSKPAKPSAVRSSPSPVHSPTKPVPVGPAPPARSPLWTLLLAAVTLAAYVPGFGNRFVDWDDADYVLQNPYVLHPTAESLGILLKSVVALNYHPLTMASLWLNAALFGPGATSLIITNVLLHVFNTVLVFRFSRALHGDQTAAGMIALLWGLHPMHVESVVWVSERKDVLYTGFFLLACLAYLRYRSTSYPGWRTGTVALFVCACLSKAMAVTLPLVLLLIDFWQGRPLRGQTVREKLPFFVVSLLVGLLAVHVQAGGDLYGWLHLLQQKDAVGQEPFALRWLVYGSYGFLMYLVKLLVPYGLVAFYPYPDTTRLAGPHYWLGPVALLLAAGWTVACLLKPTSAWRRLTGFGLGFFLVTIVLVLQFMTVGAAMMADRYSYLSYFGLLFWLVNAAFGAVSHRFRPLVQWSGGALAVLCFVLTAQQVRVWKTTETLWLNALRYYPESDQIREGLGDYYGKNNRLDDAIIQFSAAVQDGTTRYHCYEGLGNAYGLKGDLQKSIDSYDRALLLDSTKGDLYYNRALTLNKLGRYPDALKSLERALKLTPEKDTAIIPVRGFSLMQLKDYRRSLADYEYVLRKRPDDPIALHNRGVNKFYLGDRAGAIADIRRAVALRPDYEEAKQNLRQLESLN